MKTKLLRLVSPFLLLLFCFNSYAQLDYGYAVNNLDSTSDLMAMADQTTSSNYGLGEIPEALDPFNFIEAQNPQTIEEMGSELETHDPASTFAFARAMLALGAGFGFDDNQTLWCLNAAYFMQLAVFTKAALYASLGLVYSGISTDYYTASFIDFQLRLLMFNPLFQNHLVHFMWGAMIAYGIGTDKFKSGGGTTDLTRLTAALVLGLNIYLTARLALMIQTNVFAYQSQTTKPDTGGEFKDNYTWGAFNKGNVMLITLILLLGGS